MRSRMLFLALICGAGLWGQETLPSPTLQGAIHGRFVQSKTLRRLDKALLSDGSFALLPGRGLVWRTESPVRATVVVSSKGVFEVGATGRRRLTSGSDALTLMRQLLTGDVKALKRTFTLRQEGGARSWRLVLAPRPGPLAGVFRSIETEGTDYARRARLVESSGDESVIDFKDLERGPGLLSPDEEALLGP
ncbi:MAG TPA: outer membrane lipoprotein carrier protein LolA [bacterium]|jgi:hypothetical protein|nr:outer membrane lipoprotein carrier protein LolA [bacterium]